VYGFKSSEMKFHTTRYDCVQAQVDAFTWGAVATELHPHTHWYHRARLEISLVALCLAASFALGSQARLGSPAVLVLCFWAAAAAAGSKTGLPAWWFWPRVHGRRALFEDMRATVRRLSPMVEERSGHRLRLETEREGCLGGEGACVRFERLDGPMGGGESSPSSPPLTAQLI
jgi:hypothetical protein